MGKTCWSPYTCTRKTTSLHANATPRHATGKHTPQVMCVESKYVILPPAQSCGLQDVLSALEQFEFRIIERSWGNLSHPVKQTHTHTHTHTFWETSFNKFSSPSHFVQSFYCIKTHFCGCAAYNKRLFNTAWGCWVSDFDFDFQLFNFSCFFLSSFWCLFISAKMSCLVFLVFLSISFLCPCLLQVRNYPSAVTRVLLPFSSSVLYVQNVS